MIMFNSCNILYFRTSNSCDKAHITERGWARDLKGQFSETEIFDRIYFLVSSL